MRSRIGRGILAFYLLIWFGVVIPGHQRGVVTVPGSDNCCCCCCGGTTSASPNTPSPERAAHCAICDFAAHMTLPPPIDLTLPPLGLLARQNVPNAVERVARIVLLPFNSRGPPAVA